MIESVGTSSVQASALRITSQSVATSAAASQQQYPQLVSLRIRVDATLNKAILEIRSNDTGEVVQQYPSAAQIRAFQRAAQIQAAEQKQNLDVQQAQNATARTSGSDKSTGFTDSKVNASAKSDTSTTVKLPTFQPQTPQPQAQQQHAETITPAPQPQQRAPAPVGNSTPSPQAAAPSGGSTSIVV